jgi:hypothetical protein
MANSDEKFGATTPKQAWPWEFAPYILAPFTAIFFRDIVSKIATVVKAKFWGFLLLPLSCLCS